jgi:hypothetical protein
LFPLLAPDLPQFQDKYLALRSFTYPPLMLVVPILWHLFGNSRPYPHLFDTMVMLPFVLDMSANALNLYNSLAGVDWYAHLLITAIAVTAFGMALVTLPVGRLAAAALTIGFGSTVHTVWEIAEYWMMRMGALGLDLTYENTISDLTMGLLGTVIGTVLTITILWRKRYVEESPLVFPVKYLLSGAAESS